MVSAASVRGACRPSGLRVVAKHGLQHVHEPAPASPLAPVVLHVGRHWAAALSPRICSLHGRQARQRHAVAVSSSGSFGARLGAAPAAGQSSRRQQQPRAPLFPCNEFKVNGGVLYLPSFFSCADFKVIEEDCRPLIKSSQPEKNSLAKGRMIAAVPSNSATACAVMSRSMCERVGRKVGCHLLPGDYPVELRVYRQGSYMDWHVDDIMYQKPQYEMIFTISNTTDSTTQWVDASGETMSQWTEPNSLIVVKAGAALHQVTPVGRGERAIIKFILTPTLEKSAMYHEYLTTLNPFG